MSFSPPRFPFRPKPQTPDESVEPEYSGGGRTRENFKESVFNPTTRISLKRVVAAWGFGAAFMSITSGAVYTAFARELGANDFVFGVLAAALPLMSFLQVFAAKLVEHSGKRKRQMLIAGLLGRGLWAVVALLPLIARAHPGWLDKRELLNFVVGGVLLAGAIQAFTTPAFFSWMTDLVPSRVRSSFFARRMQFGTIAALLTTVATGILADQFADMRVYCVLIAFAGISGMLDIAIFIGVREPPTGNEKIAAEIAPEIESKTKRQSPPMWEMMKLPLRDLAVRRLLLFLSVLTFSYGFQGPFLWLHAKEYLHLSKTLTGLLLAGLPLVAIALTMPFWGGVLQRYGNRPVMRFASMGMAFTAVGWLVARPSAWDVLPILIFISGSLSGALELANQNLMMKLAPHVPRSSMAALTSIAAGTSFAAAAWLAGALAQSMVWINTSGLDWFGMPIVNYHILFLITLGIRLVNATFIAPLLLEPQSSGTVDAVKEVFPEIAEAFAARFTRPLGGRED